MFSNLELDGYEHSASWTSALPLGEEKQAFLGRGGCCVGPQLVWVLWEKAKCVVSVGAVQFINYYLIITKQTDCGANRAFCSRVWGISTGDKAVRT